MDPRYLISNKKPFNWIIVLSLIFIFLNANVFANQGSVTTGIDQNRQGTITIEDPHGIHIDNIKNETSSQIVIDYTHPGNCPGPIKMTFTVGGLASKYRVYFVDCQRTFQIWEVPEIVNGDPSEKATLIQEGKITYETPKPEHHWWDFLNIFGLNPWRLLVLLVIIISLVIYIRKRRK